MTSFKAKMGWDWLRKREKKLSFRLVPTQPGIDNSKKMAKKIQKHHYDFSSSQQGLGEAEKGRKKKLSIQTVSTQPVIENSKKIVKKFKKLKNIIMASFQEKMGWD